MWPVYSEKCFTRSTTHILIQKFAHSQESAVDKERPGRRQNNTAARSFLIDNTFLAITQQKIPYKTHIWIFHTLKITKIMLFMQRSS